MKPFHKIIIGFAVLLPLVTHAQFRDNAATDKNFSTFVYGLNGVFNTALTLIIAASFLAFLGGLGIRLVNIGNAEKQKEAKNIMVWGIIGLLVSVSIFGILSLGVDTFKGTV